MVMSESLTANALCFKLVYIDYIRVKYTMATSLLVNRGQHLKSVSKYMLALNIFRLTEGVSVAFMMGNAKYVYVFVNTNYYS